MSGLQLISTLDEKLKIFRASFVANLLSGPPQPSLKIS